MSSPPYIFPANLDDESEFTVQVHIWLSAAMSANYKGPKKKFAQGSKVTPSFEDRKLREKSNWVTTLPRGSTAGGHWRPATCRLREQGERCILSIFIDDVMLHKTIKLHMLHHTDIRPADDSLFSKKNCMSIDVFDQQPADRYYLLFSDKEMFTTWLCLLRSFSVFELYGRWANPEDGGLYRLWRQLDLTVVQARNLGQAPKSASASNTNGPTVFSVKMEGTESDPETLVPDVDIFCEIWLGGLLCARTSGKKNLTGDREWHEGFVFPDLPPFDKLEVVVWQQQEAAKSGKSEVLGKVKIPLATFRRGEPVEGRYPVLKSGPVAGDLRVGELKLRIRVDEEIVMPSIEYESLLKVIESRNFLAWIKDLETYWGIKTANSAFIAVALYKGTLVEQVLEHATEEIAVALQSKQTLFRAGSIFTKTMEECMKRYGQAFLEASIGSTVRRLCTEGIAIEVDPIIITSARGMEKNVETLTTWCSEFWNRIYGARNECPNELRRLFEHIRKTIAKSSQTSLDSKLVWQGISSFCFLRLIVPAIVNPHLWGLWNGMPPLHVTRSLKHIGKVILTMSNLNTSTLKEDFMRNMSGFLHDNLNAMEDYLRTISTPVPGQTPPSYSAWSSDRDEHHRGLRRRLHNIPHLGRETIPTLPHLLDLPRSLAIITSAVLHHTSKSMFNQGTPPPEALLHDLIDQCRVVEETAKDRVRELAKATTAAKPTSPLARTPLSPTQNLPSPIPIGSPPRKRKPPRPATAPVSESESSGVQPRTTFNPSQTRTAMIALEDQRADSRKRPTRTKSADSLTRTPDDGGKRKKGFLVFWK